MCERQLLALNTCFEQFSKSTDASDVAVVLVLNQLHRAQVKGRTRTILESFTQVYRQLRAPERIKRAGLEGVTDNSILTEI